MCTSVRLRPFTPCPSWHCVVQAAWRLWWWWCAVRCMRKEGPISRLPGCDGLSNVSIIHPEFIAKMFTTGFLFYCLSVASTIRACGRE